MAGHALMRRIRNRPWTLSLVGVLVILLAAGTIWWRTAGSDDDRSPSTFEERAENITGVQSAALDSKKGIHKVKISRYIRAGDLASIFEQIDGLPSELAPRKPIVYDFGGLELRNNSQHLTPVFTDHEQAADVTLAAAEIAHVTTLEISGKTLMVSQNRSGRILPTADAILEKIAAGGTDDHGVRTNVRIEVFGNGETYKGHAQLLEAQLRQPEAAWKRVHRLRNTLKKFNGRLLRGDIDYGDPIFAAVRVDDRAKMATARTAIRSAFSKNPPDVSVVADDLEVSGPVKPALGLVRRLEEAGATVTDVSTDQNQVKAVEVETASVKRLFIIGGVVGV